MNLNMILQKAWHLVMGYRALWLLGAILALVGADLLYPWPASTINPNQWLKIKITQAAILQLPGPAVTIDLSQADGIQILPQDGASWRDPQDLVRALDLEAGIDLWSILVVLVLILASVLVLGTVARYIVETALIRMVYEAETTGRRLGIREGLRMGFSLRAGRLFLLDLVVGGLSVLAFALVFCLAVSPVLLSLRSGEAIRIGAGVSTLSLLIPAALLWLAASTVLSLFLPNIRRACLLEEQDLMASIRQGVAMTQQHLKEAGAVWLAWMGIRLLWVPLGALILVLLAPALLATIPCGAALGTPPAFLVAFIASQFLSGATPWIAGALAGLPIFFVVAIAPFLFVSGLVEIFKSCLWTLAYRELRKSEESGKATIRLTVTTGTRYGTRPTEVGIS